MISRIELELLTIAKFRKAQIDLLNNGVRLEQTHGQTIDDLRRIACGDRFRFALRFLRAAAIMLAQRPPQTRDAISRSYYAMYHAARAVVYYSHGGDDFQDHDQIHKSLPIDFPEADKWSNEIKEARLRRNEADYDPYPKRTDTFANTADALYDKASEFCGLCKRHLKAKGCLT